MGRVSRGLILLNVLTFAAAWVVYAFASGLALLPAWLPVLLVGLGTALVASAIGPGYIPGRGPGTKGHTLAWLGGRVHGQKLCAPACVVPWRLYLGVWLIIGGTTLGAIGG